MSAIETASLSSIFHHRSVIKPLSLTLVLTALFGSVAHADDDDDEVEAPFNEFFITNIVHPQSTGETQWTVAPSYDRTSERSVISVPLSYEYGITDSLQFELSLGETFNRNLIGERSTQVEGEVGFGLQHSWMQVGGRSLHFALGAEVGTTLHSDEDPNALPGEDDDDSDVGFETYGVVATDVEALNNLHLTAHGGFEFEGGDSEPFINLAAALPLSGAVLSLEWNWTEDEQYITPGFTRVFESGWEFGAGAAIGIKGDTPDAQILVNIIYEY